MTRNGRGWGAGSNYSTWRKQTLYKQRSLRFDFTNLTSSFDSSGNNKISINNVKAVISLNSVVGRTGTSADISIYGLGLDMLAALSGRADGNMLDTQRINVEIFADDSVVFSGGMTSSVANMNAAPDSNLMISATANADLQNMPASPFSVNGAQKLTDVINSICSAAGYRASFNKMNGMTTSGSPYFEGSVFDQLHQICVDYGVAMSATPPQKVDFWPAKNTRDEIIPFISKDYGLIGYPIFSSGGIMFQTQYSSLLVIGRFIEMETDLPNASGKYQLSTVRHELSSWVSGGAWHSVCTAYRTNEARAEAQNKNE
ncbi:TPA: hypothetical protein U5E44_000885 [Yersinia enterocolitica]|nr:hypothetical protein [Yersinia enterocolitica]